MRKLASIQQIRDISPIDGADAIEVATMKDLEWECVVAKKENFTIGDFVVYIEIDSIVPEREEFEFLRDRKWRVRTIKLRKQVSQGLIIPLSVLGMDEEDLKLFNVGDDVTETLGVTKYDPQLREENAIKQDTKHRSAVMKYLMRNKVFRAFYLKLNSKERGNWPDWITKTDEERIQNCAKVLMKNFDKKFFITEKLDGQSATFFTYMRKKWGFSSLEFGVCSRNIWLKTPDNSNYWQVAKKYELQKRLIALGGEYVVQGEILNTNVQGNKYKVTEVDFYVFNVCLNGVLLDRKATLEFCSSLGLKVVPLVSDSFCPAEEFPDLAENTSEVVKQMVEISEAKSWLHPNIQREGIVVRLVDDPSVSMKVINPGFLLKYED